jgi:hypothetical protein
MSSTNPTDDGTSLSVRQKAVESLTEALNAEKLDEKNYHIREALQLLNLKDE